MRTRGPDPLGARTQTEHEAQVSSLEDIVGSVRKYGEPPPHSRSQTSKARCAPVAPAFKRRKCEWVGVEQVWGLSGRGGRNHLTSFPLSHWIFH